MFTHRKGHGYTYRRQKVIYTEEREHIIYDEMAMEGIYYNKQHTAYMKYDEGGRKVCLVYSLQQEVLK